MELEIIGTIVGLVYLWLEYRASIYLWIASIIMPAIYIFVYYEAGLYADFGINPYSPQWNTYLILVKDGKYSIQTSQEAGRNFWNVNIDRLSQDNSLSRSQSYVIEIIKK